MARTLASVGESLDQQDGECDEATLKKRSFVYKELIATEEDYIKDLKTVIDVSSDKSTFNLPLYLFIYPVYLFVCLFFVYFQSYYDAMDDSDSLSMPLRLRGKRDGVFGNLPEIYKFHDV